MVTSAVSGFERAPATIRPARSIVLCLVLAVVAAVFMTPIAAHADGPTAFSNTSSIAIPATGSPGQIGVASPYPSTIAVSGMAGTVSDITVVFTGLTHSSLGDVDAMVVAPTGETLVVLSDVGDPTTFTFATNATLTFDDAAAGVVPAGSVTTGSYRPTNVSSGGDIFPAPAPAPSTATTLMGAFGGINPNGMWQLFVMDDAAGDAGTIAGGWSLVITTTASAVTSTVVTTSGSPSTTGSPVTFIATVTSAASPVTTGTVSFAVDGVAAGAPIPVSASGSAQITTAVLTEGTHSIVATYSGSAGLTTSSGSLTQRVDNSTIVAGQTYCNTGALTIPPIGASSPYPSHITVSGLTGTISRVTATLNGLSHSAPGDLDVMLAAPVPTMNVLLMSDVGGAVPVTGATIVFDDAAPGPLATPVVSGTFRPSNDDTAGPDAAFPAPAPALSGSAALASFAGSSANGVWSLWVVDDATGDSGSISGGWCLTFTSSGTAAPTGTPPVARLLPPTGLDLHTPGFIASVLLVVGSAMIVIGRRHKSIRAR